jgi:hypothetical protein
MLKYATWADKALADERADVKNKILEIIRGRIENCKKIGTSQHLAVIANLEVLEKKIKELK